MKGKLALASALAVLMLPLLIMTAAASAYNYTFDRTVSPWQPAGEKAIYVTQDSLKLKYEMTPVATAGIPIPPNGYASLHQHGAEPVWMKLAYPSSAMHVLVTFDTKDFGGCQGCVPLLYVGNSAPVLKSQFKTDWKSFSTVRWTNHSFDVKIPVNTTDPIYIGDPQDVPVIYVAISYTRIDAAPTSKDMYVGIDNVNVKIYDEWASN